MGTRNDIDGLLRFIGRDGDWRDRLPEEINLDNGQDGTCKAMFDWSEPIGVVSTVPQQPVDHWKAAEQRPRPDVVADLSPVTNRLIGRPWH